MQVVYCTITGMPFALYSWQPHGNFDLQFCPNLLLYFTFSSEVRQGASYWADFDSCFSIQLPYLCQKGVKMDNDYWFLFNEKVL